MPSMTAVRWHEDAPLSLGEVERPRVEEPTDAVLRVTHTAICGTDLHVAHGRVPGLEDGNVCGHEFLGIVEEAGSGVADLEAGQRCVASMFTACGRCAGCRRLDHRACLFFGMFGMGMAFGDLAGGQAEYVRVPFADLTLLPVPDGVGDHDALMVSDILPTAWTALERCRLRAGDTLAVVGAGPLGQLVVMCAPLLGAGRVVALDLDARRLDEAAALGAEPVDASQVDPLDAVYDLTANQGADAVVEAVGSEASLRTALTIVRMGGRVAMAGTLIDEPFPMSAGEVFVRGIGLEPLLGEPLRHAGPLMALIEAGRLRPSAVVSHELPLSDALRGYELFEQREATKVVLTA